MANKNIELLRAQVGHARLWPKKNAFKYRVFYTKIPVTNTYLSKTPVLFSLNKWNIFCIYTKDHGAKLKETGWYTYITGELDKAKIPYTKHYSMTLITHPRIFGYAFNPISFWLVADEKHNLKAVMCEVTSTFKQTHNYLLAKQDNSPILPSDTILADKKLYVSPYNKTEGHYGFNFTYTQDHFKAVINYFDANGQHILNTYVGGSPESLSSGKILKSLVLYPAMAVTIVMRIHWQAVRLYFKRVKHTMKTRPRIYKNNKTTVSKKQK